MSNNNNNNNNIKYWSLEVVEFKVKPHNKRPNSIYKDSKTSGHITKSGVGMVGKLIKKG